MASAREDHSVKVAKRQNSDSCLNYKWGWRSKAAVVIWKSENSRNRVSIVTAQYFSQPKGWMTGEILDTVLSKLNQQLRSKGRSIAYLMDNAGCHPPEIKHKYRNFNIVFPNTTAKLQFKHYPELQGPLAKTNLAFHNFKD